MAPLTITMQLPNFLTLHFSGYFLSKMEIKHTYKTGLLPDIEVLIRSHPSPRTPTMS